MRVYGVSDTGLSSVAGGRATGVIGTIHSPCPGGAYVSSPMTSAGDPVMSLSHSELPA